MKRMRFAMAVALLIGVWTPQTGGAGPVKAEVSLILSADTLDILRKNGKTYFRVDALASEGFSGTVSGSITVPQASNPDQVELTDGFESKTFQFTLAAGQRISDTQSPENLAFTIRTSPTNPTNGTLQYAVTLNPSTQYMTVNAAKIVKVRVITGIGQ
jgi:hypothetical protein